MGFVKDIHKILKRTYQHEKEKKGRLVQQSPENRSPKSKEKPLYEQYEPKLARNQLLFTGGVLRGDRRS